MKKMISFLLVLTFLAALGISALAEEPVSQMDVMCAPSGIAVFENGSILVTDVCNKCVWKVTNGKSIRYAGAESVESSYGEPLGGYNDSTLEKSLFQEPWAIVPFLNGWAVSDSANNAVRLLRNGKVETVNARSNDGSLTVSDMGVVYSRPTGLAVDDLGNLYVANTGTGAVFRITGDGLTTVYCRNLNSPTGLFWYGGELYVAETGANRIVKIVQGRSQVVAGSGDEGFEDGSAEEACFSSPTGVTADKNGVIYVADTANSAVRRVADGQVDTLISPPGDAELHNAPISPRGLYIMNDRLLVCDPYARTLLAVPLQNGREEEIIGL